MNMNRGACFFVTLFILLILFTTVPYRSNPVLLGLRPGNKEDFLRKDSLESLGMEEAEGYRAMSCEKGGCER